MKEADVEIQKFKNELQIIISKSHDRFEQQLSFISAGSIAVSVAFFEQLVDDRNNVNCKILILLGWFLLVITLMVNLWSHIYSFKLHSKTIEEINNKQYEYINAENRNKKINSVNYFTITTMIIGISLIITFVALNI